MWQQYGLTTLQQTRIDYWFTLEDVQGRIEPTKYEKDGKTEYGFDFIAEEIEYLDTTAPGGGQ